MLVTGTVALGIDFGDGSFCGGDGVQGDGMVTVLDSGGDDGIGL